MRRVEGWRGGGGVVVVMFGDWNRRLLLEYYQLS